MSNRTLKVDVLARVEGEGALHVKLKGDEVTDVKFKIYEPPRFFESFLIGRAYTEAPDITARICGICPVAYLLGASQAMEAACGATVSPAIRDLRRLMYCGEWIESHALHIYLLHAPDFLGLPDAIQLAASHPDLVRRGLRLKKIGNHLMRVIGGREVHPINLRVGGFYSAPAREDLLALEGDLEWGLEAALETARLVAGFEFPSFERDYLFVALRHPDRYAIEEGRLVSSDGLDIAVSEFEDHFTEDQVRHSTSLTGAFRGRPYHVGPLARYSLNFEQLTPEAARIARELGLEPPVCNPFRSIAVRAVELVVAFEEALRLVRSYEPPHPPAVPVSPRAGRGTGCTEAPRGICYHRYTIDENGAITSARIQSPTCQNHPSIEGDLWAFAQENAALPDDELQWKLEQAIRNYDPCISCATHALRVRVSRE